MKNSTTHFTTIVIWLLPLIFIVSIYPSLPASVPMHYNAEGNVDRYGAPSEFLFFQCFMSAMAAGVYLLLIFLPRIDPKKKVQYSEGTLQKLALGIVFLLSALSLAITFATIHREFKIDKLIYPVISLFMAYAGNIMYSLKPNYFAGIRTPWTLESESNWKATHQLAGKLWFVGGLVITGLTLFIHGRAGFITFISGTIIMALIPIVYSFVYFKKHTTEQ
jgi:uncharacterized membrane protein